MGGVVSGDPPRTSLCKNMAALPRCVPLHHKTTSAPLRLQAVSSDAIPNACCTAQYVLLRVLLSSAHVGPFPQSLPRPKPHATAHTPPPLLPASQNCPRCRCPAYREATHLHDQQRTQRLSQEAELGAINEGGATSEQ